MLKSLKDNIKLLKRSKRHILLFEMAYKLLAVAVFYPVVTGVIRLCMRITGINYLTNEYIAKAFMNPVIIIFCLIGVMGFIIYCVYEMAYLAVCFETKRKGIQASIIDNIYNAFLRLKKLVRIQSIPLFLYFLISIAAINVTVVGNIVLSETIKNLIKNSIKRNRVLICIAAAAVIIFVFYFVIRDIFSFNIYMMEGKNFKDACAKSRIIVKNNALKVLGVVILYNLALLLAMYIFYLVISLILIAGVKLLDLAYIGSAVYLSVLSTLRTVVRLFLVFISIPCSFSMVSYMYYKYENSSDINFEFVDIDEGSARVNRIIYSVVLAMSIVLDVLYVVLTFNSNPFERVAIFHDTQITAHRGASKEAPENTLAAFQQAIDDMADYIELDVQMTSDGYIVVMHDASAYRTTGVAKNITDMTYEEVKKLDAGYWFSEKYRGEQVPSFEEVLKLVKANTVSVKLNVEIKSTPDSDIVAKKVVDLIKKYSMEDDCVITSFDYDALIAVKNIDKDIQTGYILSVAYGKFYEDTRVDFFSVNASFLTKRVVDAIHNTGKQVYAWTVNNDISIKNLANKGIDNIITDVPVTAREVVYSRNTSETITNMIKYVFNK